LAEASDSRKGKNLKKVEHLFLILCIPLSC
jgi:hypothetical protein